MVTSTSIAEITAQIHEWAKELQLDLCGITPAIQPPGYHPLLEWMTNGYCADMDWMQRRKDAYAHPDGVLPDTRSVIAIGLNYHNGNETNDGCRISRYAWGQEDYHSLLKKKLKQLSRKLRELLPHAITRPVVDTAPLLERDFAQLAGLGWRGKNTMLINPSIGSWFFLGAILTTAKLQYDQPFQADHCGTCTRCLDACPTDAFPEPGTLNAERCISYLTIERRSKTISEELMPKIQDWIFGCDICQDVCPWNRFAPTNSVEAFHRRPEVSELDLPELLNLTEATFKSLFRKTPLERTGRDIIVRNAAIAAANTMRIDCLPILEILRTDDSPIVQHAVGWSIQTLTRTSSSDEAPLKLK